jgi:hypothetical protein
VFHLACCVLSIDNECSIFYEASYIGFRIPNCRNRECYNLLGGISLPNMDGRRRPHLIKDLFSLGGPIRKQDLRCQITLELC